MCFSRIFTCALLSLGLSGCGGDGEEVLPGPVPPEPYAYDETKAVHTEFSGERALELTAKVVEFGPRPPGTGALEKTRVFVEGELKKLGWEVKRQTFTDQTPQGEIEFVNLRARYAGEGSADWESAVAVLLGGHYDTKFYDNMVFVGANDGGSSTGGLIEAGRALANNPDVAKRVEIVFFDGEECFVNYTDTDGLYGSRHYTAELRRRGVKSFPGAMVLLDIIADRDLLIEMPTNCDATLMKRTMLAARDLGFQQHFIPGRGDVTDDHVPFNHLRIPTIDLIEGEYTAWHTSRDTMDKLSARSLEKVGRTALLLIEKYILPEPVDVTPGG